MTQEEAQEYERSNWTVDRRIPIALIVTLLTYGVGFVWWASTQNHKIESLQTIVADIPEARRKVAVIEFQIQDLSEDVKDVKRHLNAIDEKLDRAIGKLPRTPSGGR